MKELKKYHQRKLAIIEMIDNCQETIDREERFIKYCSQDLAFTNVVQNIERLEKIKSYLIERYNR